MKRHIAATLGLAMIAAACAGPQEATVDLQAEATALQAAAQAYDDAIASGDAAAVAAFYMEDAVAYPPNEPTVEGRAGFEEYAASFLGGSGIQMDFGQAQVVVAASGDLGYTYAEIAVTLDGPHGETMTEAFRDFHVWAKDADGAWRVAVDIWNSPDPLPGMGN
ncbi:MAG: hypothetical protein BMS9Abin29_2452 [Gemmatimonadota bacterium]|nr:MAG: hypothetical protein BMS9Abin29_2452 [Gemmatimonadota bacterium]